MEEAISKKEENTSKKEESISKKSASKSTTKSSTTKSTKKSTPKKTTSKSKNNNKAAALEDEVIVVKNTENETYLVPSRIETKSKSWPLVIGLLILFVVMILAFVPWSNTFGLDIMSKATEAVNGFKLFKFELFAKLLDDNNISYTREFIIHLVIG